MTTNTLAPFYFSPTFPAFTVYTEQPPQARYFDLTPMGDIAFTRIEMGWWRCVGGEPLKLEIGRN